MKDAAAIAAQDGEYTRRELIKAGGVAALATMLGTLLPRAAKASSGPGSEGTFEIMFGLYPFFDMLDVSGPAEVFVGLPNVKLRFASPDGGAVKSFYGIAVTPTERLADVESVDMICIPGGANHAAMLTPAVQREIVRLADQAKYVTSVCNGSLILGAAGVLKGRRSACHWASLNLLKEYGAIPDPARVVKDGRFISGGGVTAGIDFGLTIAADLAGPLEAQAAQLSMQYSPAPPFNAGSRETAPAEVMRLIETRLPNAGAGMFRL